MVVTLEESRSADEDCVISRKVLKMMWKSALVTPKQSQPEERQALTKGLAFLHFHARVLVKP